MELGNFSISLAVKDLDRSMRFYEALGFEVFAGEVEAHWVIMKNGDLNIGLFQGMFENNILTFNPGWDSSAQKLDNFTDIRELQRVIKDKGIAISSEIDEGSSGPASFMIIDPEGNPILFDQHV